MSDVTHILGQIESGGGRKGVNLMVPRCRIYATARRVRRGNQAVEFLAKNRTYGQGAAGVEGLFGAGFDPSLDPVSGR